MFNSKKFFKQDGNSLIFTGTYMEVYLPNYYFTDDIATPMGNFINTFGLFNFGVFVNDKALESERQLYHLILPCEISVGFYNSYKEDKVLKKEYPKESYTILMLKSGDVFVKDLNIIKDVDNANKFITLFHSGKLPIDIPYNKILELYNEAMELSGIDLGIPSSTIEFMIGELYRDKDNPSIPFRISAGSGKSGMLDYKPTSIKNLASINSTFTALSFENMGQSIISSIDKSRNKTEETISPVEKVIKY